MPAASYVLDGRAVYWPSTGGCSSKLAMAVAGSGRRKKVVSGQDDWRATLSLVVGKDLLQQESDLSACRIRWQSALNAVFRAFCLLDWREICER